MIQNKRHIRPSKTALLAAVTLTILVAGCSNNSNKPDPSERFELAKMRMMERWDINEDGDITCEDATLMRQQKFNAADLNQDGGLTEDEFRNASWSNPAFAAEHLRLYDDDHSGLVSLAEFEKHADNQFQIMDLNSNCVISDRELARALSAGFGRGSQGGRGNKPKQR